MTMMTIRHLSINTAVTCWRVACEKGDRIPTRGSLLSETAQQNVLSVKSSFILLLSNPVTNHTDPCFSCLLPPNILVRMMMSDRDSYILPQLASHPCSPLSICYRRRVDTCPSVTHLPFPPFASRLAGLLPPVSQPAIVILNVCFIFPFSIGHWDPTHWNQESVKAIACQSSNCTFERMEEHQIN